MTMIACTINNGYPIVLGDILLSSPLKPEAFTSPTLVENLMHHLPDDRAYYPAALSQKIYIIANNFCFAFAGNVASAKSFLEDLTIRFGSEQWVTVDHVIEFFHGYGL